MKRLRVILQSLKMPRIGWLVVAILAYTVAVFSLIHDTFSLTRATNPLVLGGIGVCVVSIIIFLTTGRK